MNLYADDTFPGGYLYVISRSSNEFPGLDPKVSESDLTCGWYLNVFPLRVLASWIYEVYPDWEGDRRDIRALIKDEDYRKLFVSAVNEYAREKHCTIKEALLAFRIPASRYYYWKSGARDDLLKP